MPLPWPSCAAIVTCFEEHVTASTSTGKVGLLRRRHVSRSERRRSTQRSLFSLSLLCLVAAEHGEPQALSADYWWAPPASAQRPQAPSPAPASTLRLRLCARYWLSSWTIRTYQVARRSSQLHWPVHQPLQLGSTRRQTRQLRVSTESPGSADQMHKPGARMHHWQYTHSIAEILPALNQGSNARVRLAALEQGYVVLTITTTTRRACCYAGSSM